MIYISEPFPVPQGGKHEKNLENAESFYSAGHNTPHNYDFGSVRTERKYCICTAMLFDPADPHRAQREREARNQTKKD